MSVEDAGGLLLFSPAILGGKRQPPALSADVGMPCLSVEDNAPS